jgi:hypothetical protein
LPQEDDICVTKNSKENLGKMALKLNRDFRECEIVKERSSDNLKQIAKAVPLYLLLPV